MTLEKLQELLDRQARNSNKRAQSSHSKLGVQRNREIRPLTLLGHHQMASRLSTSPPTSLLKGSYRLLAR